MNSLVQSIVKIAIGSAMSLPASTPIPVKNPTDVWVMIIDTGISPHDKLRPNVQYDSSENYIDNHGHGTHIAGIVMYGNHLVSGQTLTGEDPVCPNVKIFSCKNYEIKNSAQNNLLAEISCVKLATKMKVDYINYSGGGGDFSNSEYLAYREFLASGGVAVVAAGNEQSNLSDHPYYPASYALASGFTKYQKDMKKPDGSKVYTPISIISVQNVNSKGEHVLSSNTHPLSYTEIGTDVVSTLPKNGYGTMTGTSQSTAEFTHLLLKQKCKELKK